MLPDTVHSRSCVTFFFRHSSALSLLSVMATATTRKRSPENKYLPSYGCSAIIPSCSHSSMLAKYTIYLDWCARRWITYRELKIYFCFAQAVKTANAQNSLCCFAEDIMELFLKCKLLIGESVKHSSTGERNVDSHLLCTELKDFSYLLEASPKFLKCDWSRRGFLKSGDNWIACFLYHITKAYFSLRAKMKGVL